MRIVSCLYQMLNEPLTWNGPIYTLFPVAKSWCNPSHLLPHLTLGPLVHPSCPPPLITLICMLPFNPFKRSQHPFQFTFKLNIPHSMTLSSSGMMSFVRWLRPKINTFKTLRLVYRLSETDIFLLLTPFLSPSSFSVLFFLPIELYVVALRTLICLSMR